MNDRKQHPGRVEDFTDAFLVSFGVVVFMALWTVNVLIGFIYALLVAYGGNKIMTLIHRRR